MAVLAPTALAFPILQQEFEEGPLVYLDSAATSQKPEPVLGASIRSRETRPRTSRGPGGGSLTG
jgi:selenocysteine lyase/cysteine desulfurase